MRASERLRGLSLEEKAAQLLVVGFDGKSVDNHLATLLERGVGGVILFRRNVGTPDEILALCREIHRLSRISPPLISIDQEPGLIARLGEPFTIWPGAAAVGETGDAELARAVGKAIATELKAVGINIDWAPVVDVNSNPRNPIIGPRAFGDDPALVSKLGRAFIRGMQDAGVAACAKHYPGHGDTRADSHVTLPVVDRSRREIERTELPPFAAAARAGVATIMSAHVLYPALDKNNPATISKKIITGILREKLRYGGVVVTDDLAMMGIAQGRAHEDVAAAAVAAGCDVLLAGQDFRNQHRYLDGVAEAVHSGELPLERVHRSLRRVWKLKEKFACKPPQAVNSRRIGSPAHRRLAARAGANAV